MCIAFAILIDNRRITDGQGKKFNNISDIKDMHLVQKSDQTLEASHNRRPLLA